MNVKVIKEFGGRSTEASTVHSQTLVLDMDTGAYYLVSTASVMLTGLETLVFPAKSNGEVTSWGEVAGGRGMSREEAIADLQQNGASL